MTAAPKTAIQISASLNVDDRSVLPRSSDTVSNAADGMDERIGLLPVDFAADTADIDINDVGRGVEMEIPDMLQQHRSWNNLTFVANQVFENLEFSRQQRDFPAAARGRS